jgi:hypothetical protein
LIEAAMTSKPLTDNAILLDRREILALMKLMEARALLGMNLAEQAALSDADEKAAAASLKSKGILEAAGKKNRIAPGMLPLLSALMFPERAVLVFRDLPGLGKQVLTFLHKEGTTLLHSFPKEGQHRLAPFGEPADVMKFLLNMFPLNLYPPAAAKFQVSREALERARASAEQGKSEEALAALPEAVATPEEKKALVDAIASRKISGSFALVTCKDGEITDAKSYAAVGGDNTGWWISSGEAQGDAEMFSVERTGSDFTIKMQSLAGQLTGALLAVSKIGKDKNITKYLLSADEFALSLALINMPQSGAGFLSTVYESITQEQFNARTKAAEQSLVDRGLAARSSTGLATLITDLQYALLPVVRFDSMIRIRTISKAKKSEANLYSLKGKSFTARFGYGGAMQVLETGKDGDLLSYLLNLYPLFGEGDKKDNTDSAGQISLDALSKTLDSGSDPSQTEKTLTAAGFPAGSAKLLAEDLAQAEYRGTLEKKIASEQPGKIADGAPLFALLLLKAPQRSWLFHFPVADSQAKGTAKIVGKQGFQSALADFLIK